MLLLYDVFFFSPISYLLRRSLCFGVTMREKPAVSLTGIHMKYIRPIEQREIIS
jgi:hypothetical protein